MRHSKYPEKLIIDDYLSNLPIIQISEKYKIKHETTIYRILKRNNIKVNRDINIGLSIGKIACVKIPNNEYPNLIKLYNSGLNCTEISKIYNVHFSLICRILKRLGTNIIKRKYPINENFFKKIDTPEKAYIFGFIMADGSNNLEHNSVNIQIKYTDKEVLKYIRKNVFLDETKPFYIRKPKEFLLNNKVCHRTKSGTLELSSSIISKDLNNHGCIPNKTRNYKKVTIPYHFYHFLRGLLDGDGYIVYTDKSKTIGFSLNKNFAQQLSVELETRGIKCFINKSKSESMNYLTISRTDHIKFLKKLYKNDCFSLSRKKKIAIKYLEDYV